QHCFCSRKPRPCSPFPKSRDCCKIRIILRRILDRRIRGIRRRSTGQRDPVLARQFERQAHVFVHQPQRKTRRELTLHDHWRFHVEHSRARHARLHHLHQFFRRHSRRRNQRQSLRERIHL